MVCIIMVLLIIIGVIVLLISAITEKKSDSPKLENEEKKYEQYYDDIGNYNMNMNINGKTFAWSGGSVEMLRKLIAVVVVRSVEMLMVI